MSSAQNAEFPAPDTAGIGAQYWSELRDGRLVFQHCGACGHAWLPPRTECPRCLAATWSWRPASGKAKLVSWVVYHQEYHPWFAGRLPYNVAVVELEEGPRLISNIVDARDRLRIEMPLQLAIQTEAGVALARFTPA
jgi:hypothetical protein